MDVHIIRCLKALINIDITKFLVLTMHIEILMGKDTTKGLFDIYI